MSLVKLLSYIFRLFRKPEKYHVIYPKSYDDILEVKSVVICQLEQVQV